MQILHNDILRETAIYLQTSLKTIFPELTMHLEDVYKNITRPPNLQMGHLSFACFPLSKALKKAPPQISTELCETLKPNQLISKIQSVGPYLNLFLNMPHVSQFLLPTILDHHFFSTKLFSKKKKIMVEYSQPNTHKELHVGHMRNVCLGNAIVRLNRYGGHDVIAANYIGDVGTHVAKCLWYLKEHNKELEPDQDKGSWIGSMYTLATLKLDELKDGPDEQKAKEQITNILKELEGKKGFYYELWLQTKKWSMDLFHTAYAWADVHFDKWYFESDVDSSSLKLAMDLYEQGHYIKSEGAIGMDLSSENLGFAMMIKSDGTGMYATKDIMLAKQKFEQFNRDISYYVVDKRQTLHFKQVFKVLESIQFAQAKNCIHLAYDFVELPDGAMSSRKGNIIPLTTLITEMEETIKTQFLHKYQQQWSEQEINHTARIIANGAIKYGMLRMDEQRKIVFDLDEWLKLEGETGPYLQYVYARIYSMGEKFHFNSDQSINYNVFQTPQEEALLLQLSSFNDVVQYCLEQNKTNALCSYLYDLGKLFNNFYAACPIGKASEEDTKHARLALSKAVAEVIKQGLALLGIETPTKM